MSTPGGKSVGRLSVRVVPDTTKLREDLKKVFARIERTMQINVRVEAATAAARRDVDRFVNDVNGQTATVNVGLDTAAARLRLTSLARPRRVQLLPEVSKVAAAKALSALAALSGSRAITERLQGIGRAIGDLDRNMPRFAAIALGVANLSSVLLASTSGLLGVAVSLASIAAAGVAIPGILAGIGIGAGIMVAALVDAGDQLASLKPAFSRLQDVISAEFWSQARAPIIELARSLLPEIKAGAAGVAEQLGLWTAALSGSLQSALSGGQLEAMFANLGDSISVAAGGTGALAGLLSTLGTVGSQYLPRLAEGFVGVTTKLNDFLSAAAQNGQLQSMIDVGIAAAQQLGGVLANVGQILLAVSNAALDAGAGGLASLNAGLGAIAQIVSGPVFQTALITIFSGAAAAVEALAGALGPIGNLLTSLAPTIGYVLTIAGQAVSGLVSQIAGALSQPEVAQGIHALIDGLAAGLAAIGPALGPVATALGTLAGVAGTVAANLGNVLGAALTAIAPLITTVLTAVQPLIPILGGLLVTAIQTLAPWLSTVLTALLPPLAAALGTIVQAIGPVIQALAPLTPVFATIAGNVAGLLPVLSTLVVSVLQALAAILPPIVDAMNAWAVTIAPLEPALFAMLQAMIPLTTVGLPLLVDVIQQASGMFIEFIDSLAPMVPDLVELAQSFADLAVAMLPVAVALMPSLIEFMHLMYTPLTGLARLFLTLLVPAVSGASKQIRDASASVQEFTAWLGNIRDSVGETSQKVAGAFASIRGAVEGAFANIGNWLRDSGKSLIQGFINGINDKIADAKGAVSNVLDKVRNLFPFSPAKEGPFSGRGWVRYSGQSISTALAQGIRERTPLARTAALDLVSAAHPGANGLIAAAAAYTGPSNGAAGVGSSSAAPAVELSGTFYSYDPTALLAEAQKKARDKQAVAQLRTITRAR